MYNHKKGGGLTKENIEYLTRVINLWGGAGLAAMVSEKNESRDQERLDDEIQEVSEMDARTGFEDYEENEAMVNHGYRTQSGTTFGRPGDGMTSVGLYTAISQMLKFLSIEDLQCLRGDIDRAVEIVREVRYPWRQGGTTSESILNFVEKATLLGIPCKSHPMNNIERQKEPNKIMAVKLLRSRIGFGLRQAKEIMDDYQEGVKTGKFDYPEIPASEKLDAFEAQIELPSETFI